MEPIDPQDWQALVDAGQEQDAEPGQVLVREGATGGSLFVVLSGTVLVTRGGRRAPCLVRRPCSTAGRAPPA